MMLLIELTSAHLHFAALALTYLPAPDFGLGSFDFFVCQTCNLLPCLFFFEAIHLPSSLLPPCDIYLSIITTLSLSLSFLLSLSLLIISLRQYSIHCIVRSTLRFVASRWLRVSAAMMP
ncbi:hypothetical protein BDV06DRAFT_16543 [Aspergillus oleicola]